MDFYRTILWIGAPLPELETDDFFLRPAAGVAEALEWAGLREAGIVFLNFPIPPWTAADLLEAVERADPSVPVILRDPGISAAAAASLAKLGAFQVFDAGAGPLTLLDAFESAAEERRRGAALESARVAEPWKRLLIGESRAMQEIGHMIRLVGPRRCTALITGETGTGKEMAARALHLAGPRAQLPLVAVNCSALPEPLLESELFGHVRGAFTGATGNRIGRFEQAHRGSIFLDEVGDLPLSLQAKLLRVLQEREFQRVGSSETTKVDVRVIAATNCGLEDAVDRSRFREDLYYRLNVAPIRMPALRERPADVPLLALHFIEKICRLEDLPLKRASSELLERLSRCSWPGNVRQLENAVEMAVALSGSRQALYASDFRLPQSRDKVVSISRPAPAQFP
ncbi:MAG: sigma-54-dependent Fis family transcriptional regulator, partial [Acidobacteria bacterium]|nr:sigma-54-dependent Fis family transcriptional regulator [Acidobacteriota bacterium]